MRLETVKIYSRNQAIRGKEFDVYFTGVGSYVHLSEINSVEEKHDAINLIDSFTQQDLFDVQVSLNNVLSMKNINDFYKSFTQEQLNAGYVSDAQSNKARGWCND